MYARWLATLAGLAWPFALVAVRLQSETRAVSELKVPKARLRELIARAIDEGNQLLREAEEEVTDAESFRRWTEDRERWDARTRQALSSGLSGDFADEFRAAATGAIFRVVGQTDDETFEHSQEAIRRGINVLRSIDERLEFLAEPSAFADQGPFVESPAPDARQVFVVHGRDHAARDRVARFVDRLGLEAIILDEQSNRGRTLIEKFEQHALNVGYAIVLLTPDDFGRGPDESAWPDAPNRARQNVILELGYFMGVLGRARTAALFVAGVELPSDIHGLLYIPLDDGSWALRLAKEMRDAGLPVDLNAI